MLIMKTEYVSEHTLFFLVEIDKKRKLILVNWFLVVESESCYNIGN